MALDDQVVGLIRDSLQASREHLDERLTTLTDTLERQASESRASREHAFAELRRDMTDTNAKVDALTLEWSRYKWALRVARRIAIWGGGTVAFLGYREQVQGWIIRLFHLPGGGTQ